MPSTSRESRPRAETVSASVTPSGSDGQLRKHESVERTRQKARPGHDEQEQRRPLARHHSLGTMRSRRTARGGGGHGGHCEGRYSCRGGGDVVGVPSTVGTSGAMALTRGTGEATYTTDLLRSSRPSPWSRSLPPPASRSCRRASSGGTRRGRRAPALGGHARLTSRLGASRRAGLPLLGDPHARAGATHAQPGTAPDRGVHPRRRPGEALRRQVGLSARRPPGGPGSSQRIAAPVIRPDANRVSYARGSADASGTRTGRSGSSRGCGSTARPAATGR